MIDVINVSKTYKRLRALSPVSLNLSSGIYGLLGPNGAGKTTFIHILATLTASDSGGEILFRGVNIKENLRYYRSRLGFMPQELRFPEFFSVIELLMYIAHLKGIKSEEAKKQIEQLLDTTNLTSKAFDKIKSLSGGMKQRLNLAQAFLGDPEIILLDEPTRGLDIEEQDRILNFVAGQKNKVVLISSHVVKDITFACSDVLILSGGQLLYGGELSDLMDSYKHRIWYKTFHRALFSFDDFQFEPISHHVKDDAITVKIFSDIFPGDGWQNGEISLEDVYLKIIE